MDGFAADEIRMAEECSQIDNNQSDDRRIFDQETGQFRHISLGGFVDDLPNWDGRLQ